MQTLDKHGEPLGEGDRVMLDGALTGTVVTVEEDGTLRVRVDGDPGAVLDLHCEAIGWQAPDVESLGDGINQSMRAAQGQPN